MLGTSFTDLVRLQYGYNRASSRIWRKDLMAAAASAEYDEHYSYDGLQRLGDMQRGTLNATKTGLTSETFGQCWTLDATGNWQRFRQDSDGNGVWNLEQSRTANSVNEITGIAATTGPTWVTPAYDPAGNMTTIPQPQDPTSSYTATYDAWNRLVKLTDDGGSSPGSSSSSSANNSSSSSGSPVVVAEYEYDARNFRIHSWEPIPGTTHAEHRWFYYNEQWQVLEERSGIQTFPWFDRQYVWGIRYIDDLIVRQRFPFAGTSQPDDVLFAMQDANWNVVATQGTEGGSPTTPISERYTYTPYGQPSFLDWDYTPLTASQYGWQYLFTGLRWSENTGLTYARNRDLHPKLGVWLRRDPAGLIDGFSLYVAYFILNGTDPYGLDWLDNAANFSAGVGDSLSFGLTYGARSLAGTNKCLNTSSTAYKSGEWTETAAEAIVTGGSALLKKLAQRKAINLATKKFGKEAAEKMTKDQLTKHGNQLIQEAARPYKEAARKANDLQGGIMHHPNPLSGHPGMPGYRGGAPTKFPTGGLPDHIASGRWNLQHVRDVAEHTRRHLWTKRLENAADWMFFPSGITIPGRIGSNHIRHGYTDPSPIDLGNPDVAALLHEMGVPSEDLLRQQEEDFRQYRQLAEDVKSAHSQRAQDSCAKGAN